MKVHMRLEDSRTIETPAAVMRTLASPTTDPPADFAVWRTELPAGSAGPTHTVDVDHVVVVVEGSLEVRLGEAHYRVDAADVIKLPAGVVRQISPADGAPAVTLTVSSREGSARVGDAAPVPLPWSA